MSPRERYPDADILSQRGHWDVATRQVVLDRVHNTPPFRFFDVQERRTLEALCECVIPQSHRQPEKRVPLAPWIDARCAGGHHDGTRRHDMPAHDVAWRLGLAGLDQTARALFGGEVSFAGLNLDQQTNILEAVRSGDPPGDVWGRLPARLWWTSIALRQISGVYYAHPLAWDEIGFGGPAYPRGYFALNFGYPEPWEAREVGEAGNRVMRPRWRFP